MNTTILGIHREFYKDLNLPKSASHTQVIKAAKKAFVVGGTGKGHRDVRKRIYRKMLWIHDGA